MGSKEIDIIIKKGCLLLENVENYPLKNIDGLNRLKRKINTENLFLEKAIQSNSIKLEYLKCNFLFTLEQIWSYVLKLESCTAIFKNFTIANVNNYILTVDIVSHGGEQWNKVICRRADALLKNWKETKTKSRNIVRQGVNYIKCAQQNQLFFKSPRVVFHFISGIAPELANALLEIGIIVKDGTTNGDSNKVGILKEEAYFHNENEMDYLNLDITAMIAYTTSLTNDGCVSENSCSIIRNQAIMEQKQSVKKEMNKLFEGKRLFCCETARIKFQSIVNVVAGPLEKIRAEEFLQNITVVPDSPSDRALLLECKGKIKPQLITIFGTGDRLMMTTVTSSIGFVNSAKQQGVNFAVHIHELRLFSEKNMK